MEQSQREIFGTNVWVIDTGFMGSILNSWIKLAHAEKYFLLNHIYLNVKSTAVKFASIDTMGEEVGLCINLLKKTLRHLKRDRSHGIQD